MLIFNSQIWGNISRSLQHVRTEHKQVSIIFLHLNKLSLNYNLIIEGNTVTDLRNFFKKLLAHI